MNILVVVKRGAEKKALKKREGERGVEQEGRRGERRGVEQEGRRGDKL